MDADREEIKWCDFMALEVNSLIDIDCFEFKISGTKLPDSEYQETKLHCVFKIKNELRQKSMLVAGVHLIDVPTYFQIYSSQVKPISVKLVGVIAYKMVLKKLCGDVSNAYVNSDTSHKVYVPVAGPKFGSRSGQMIVIKYALYLLSTS